MRFEKMPRLVFNIIQDEFKRKFGQAKWNGRYWVLPKSEERTALLFGYRLLGRKQVELYQMKEEPPARFEQQWVQGRLF